MLIILKGVFFMKIVLIVYDWKKFMMVKLVIVYKIILEKYEFFVIGMIG